MTTGTHPARRIWRCRSIHKKPHSIPTKSGPTNAMAAFLPKPRMAPDPAAISAAAEALIGAKRAVAVCGGGPVISGAEAELRALAGLFNMPISTTVSGQGSVAETDPLAVGVGWLQRCPARPQSQSLMKQTWCFSIGCRCRGSVTTERWRSPQTRYRPIIHIDSDPEVIGANYATESGDKCRCKTRAGRTRQGPSAAQRSAPISMARHAQPPHGRTNWLHFEPLANSSETPIRPERVIATLQHLLPQDAIIVADPGTPCPYFSAHLPLAPTAGRNFITNRAHGALGYALAASMGAHVGPS